MTLTAIILTYNEDGTWPAVSRASRGWRTGSCAVVDGFSTDATLAIAQAHGARVVQRAWVNHTTQFNWALTQLDADTDWVLRIDADEVLTPALAAALAHAGAGA